MWKNRKSQKRHLAARLQSRFDDLITLCKNNNVPAVQDCLTKWPTYLALRGYAWVHAYKQTCQNNHIDLCQALISDLTEWGEEYLSAAVKISTRYGHKDLVDNFLDQSSLKKYHIRDVLIIASQLGWDVLVEWLLNKMIITARSDTYLDALAVCKQKSTVRLIVHKWLSPEPCPLMRQLYYKKTLRVVPLHLLSAVLMQPRVPYMWWLECCSLIFQRQDLNADVTSDLFSVLEPQKADMLADEIMCLLVLRFGLNFHELMHTLPRLCLNNLEKTKTLAPIMTYCINHIKDAGHPHSLPIWFAERDNWSAATFLLDCGAQMAWFPCCVRKSLVDVHKRRCRATEKLLCVWLSTNISRHVLASYVCFSE
jgi:hypothetical protein